MIHCASVPAANYNDASAETFSEVASRITPSSIFIRRTHGRRHLETINTSKQTGIVGRFAFLVIIIIIRERFLLWRSSSFLSEVGHNGNKVFLKLTLKDRKDKLGPNVKVFHSLSQHKDKKPNTIINIRIEDHL